MKSIIVTADDLGLTNGVNSAIEQGHQARMVTATSLLAVGRAFDDAVAMCERNPTLDVGVHLALVGEDPPLCSPDTIGSLVDENGCFPLSYRTVVTRGASGRLVKAHIRQELNAQMERILDAGIRPTHLDAHQHTHLWPLVGAVAAELAERYRIGFVRVPHARRWHPVTIGVNALAAHLRSQLRKRGLSATSTYAGLDEAGHLTAAQFANTLRTVAHECPQLVEINCHPGLPTDTERARFEWGFEWGAELEMLTAPATNTLLNALGYQLTKFSDLS